MNEYGSVLHDDAGQGSAAPENVADTHQPDEFVETELSDSVAAGDEPQHEPEPRQPDWDTDDNPYRQRLKGIQSRLQREIEEKRAYEHRLMQMEQQQVYEQAQQMHPRDRQSYIQNWQAQRQADAERRAIRQREAVLEQAARETVMRDISQKWGVPKEQLSRFNDPDSMEYHAQALAQTRRQQNRTNRQMQGSDRFEGESPGRARQSRVTGEESWEELQQRFVNEAQRLQARQ